jgi:parvulin-like peptidyl-prolyl isomerase
VAYSLLNFRHRLTWLIAVGLMGGILLTACSSSVATPAFDFTPSAADSGGGQGGPAPIPSGEVIATVNGQPILAETFQRELARYEAGQVALGLQVADPEGYAQQILDQMIEQELIRQQAIAQGLTVSDAEVDQVISSMSAEGGPDYFNSWLNTSYYTLDEFREVMRLQLMTNKLTAPIVAGVPTAVEQVHARHILVNTQAQAEEVLARLNGGEDFAALAAEYSTDITTRQNGGDLSWFPRGGLLVPEVEEAAFSLQPGQTSDVVQSAWGFHIIQTLEFDPARQVDDETHQRMIKKAVDDWAQGLRIGADIQKLISPTP